jgi:hypothetical protein
MNFIQLTDTYERTIHVRADYIVDLEEYEADKYSPSCTSVSLIDRTSRCFLETPEEILRRIKESAEAQRTK